MSAASSDTVVVCMKYTYSSVESVLADVDTVGAK